ncbi:hypothetical protein B0H17DRAFT_1151086 [Mycena rosella]|uniref:Uncharacterized protein n=1 Tax=Mycena rosella TaxID=1033263 RepID=A0AAD7BNR5_MYCRO|nr:hypothetical protein B0H17DRAFT_1151086 [Mycena rosella]
MPAVREGKDPLVACPSTDVDGNLPTQFNRLKKDRKTMSAPLRKKFTNTPVSRLFERDPRQWRNHPLPGNPLQQHDLIHVRNVPSLSSKSFHLAIALLNSRDIFVHTHSGMQSRIIDFGERKRQPEPVAKTTKLNGVGATWADPAISDRIVPGFACLSFAATRSGRRKAQA